MQQQPWRTPSSTGTTGLGTLSAVRSGPGGWFRGFTRKLWTARSSHGGPVQRVRPHHGFTTAFPPEGPMAMSAGAAEEYLKMTWHRRCVWQVHETLYENILRCWNLVNAK